MYHKKNVPHIYVPHIYVPHIYVPHIYVPHIYVPQKKQIQKQLQKKFAKFVVETISARARPYSYFTSEINIFKNF